MRRLLAGAMAVLTLAGCATPQKETKRVTVLFADVLDLVPYAAVKVNDVTVGSVEKISLRGWAAEVKLRVNADVKLPDNATAALRQTSLLGEKFVALAAPVGERPQGELSDGDEIPLSHTRRSAEVEEVLAALALVLNGGGLAELKTINTELAKVMSGREPNIKGALNQLNTFVGGLEAQKSEITRAITNLDRLSAQLAAQRGTVAGAIDALAPATTTLAAQRTQLTGMLTALGRLGTVGTKVINQSREDTLADLRALQPTLQQLAKAGDDLPKSLDFLASYPFPPNVTGAIIGDYVNLHVTLDLDASLILTNLLTKMPQCKDPDGPPSTGPPKPCTLPGNPTPAPQPIVPGLPTPPGINPPGSPPGGPTLPLPINPATGMAPGEANARQGSLLDLLRGGLR